MDRGSEFDNAKIDCLLDAFDVRRSLSKKGLLIQSVACFALRQRRAVALCVDVTEPSPFAPFGSAPGRVRRESVFVSSFFI